MSNFELVQKYGASVFVIHKFLEENPNVGASEISAATGLSDRWVKEGLRTLVAVNLLNRVSVPVNKYGTSYKYNTIQ